MSGTTSVLKSNLPPISNVTLNPLIQFIPLPLTLSQYSNLYRANMPRLSWPISLRLRFGSAYTVCLINVDTIVIIHLTYARRYCDQVSLLVGWLCSIWYLKNYGLIFMKFDPDVHLFSFNCNSPTMLLLSAPHLTIWQDGGLGGGLHSRSTFSSFIHFRFFFLLCALTESDVSLTFSMAFVTLSALSVATLLTLSVDGLLTCRRFLFFGSFFVASGFLQHTTTSY